MRRNVLLSAVLMFAAIGCDFGRAGDLGGKCSGDLEGCSISSPCCEGSACRSGVCFPDLVDRSVDAAVSDAVDDGDSTDAGNEAN